MFGTMHIMNAAFQVFTDMLHTLIEKSDVVFTEMKVTPVGNQQPEIKLYERIDDYIANRAAGLQIPLRALETEKIRKAAGLELRLEERDIRKFLELMKALSAPDKETRRLIYTSLLHKGATNDTQPTINRNVLWMESILQAAATEKKNCFIACGAAHLRGAHSIPNLLRHEGFKITPLMKVLPMTNKEMLRQTVVSTGMNLFAHPRMEPERNVGAVKSDVSSLQKRKS